MPEYREFRCCLCPQLDKGIKTCPAPHGEEPCRFVKHYVDERGWIYFVRAGIGDSNYKTFYRKPGTRKESGWRCVPWQKSFDDAQGDLNREAQKRGWEEV